MPAPIIIPIATAAIAGGTAIAKGMANRTKVSKVYGNRLAELERLAALGALGLSAEELAAYREQRLGGVDAATRELQERSLAASSPADLGAGAFQAQAMKQMDEAQRARQAGSRDIMAADVARAGEQRAEMQKLAKVLEDQKAARKREAALAVLDGIDAAVQTGFSAATGLPPLGKTDEGTTEKVDEATLELDEDELLNAENSYNYFTTGG